MVRPWAQSFRNECAADQLVAPLASSARTRQKYSSWGTDSGSSYVVPTVLPLLGRSTELFVKSPFGLSCTSYDVAYVTALHLSTTSLMSFAGLSAGDSCVGGLWPVIGSAAVAEVIGPAMPASKAVALPSASIDARRVKVATFRPPDIDSYTWDVRHLWRRMLSRPSTRRC